MGQLRIAGIWHEWRSGRLEQRSNIDQPKGGEMKNDTVADLTWANLYIRRIRQDLSALTPAVKKIAASGELAEIVAKLRKEVEAAYRIIAELRTLTESDRCSRSQNGFRSEGARRESCGREPFTSRW